MDVVFLRELRIDTVIGIYDWERRIKQTISLDIDMATDVARAAAGDAIEHALDYKAVAKQLIEFVGASRFKLVETLAEACAELVLNEFDVSWVRIKLDKPGAVRGSASVGVIIERGRDD
jgi:dihydroneopterin aldolase